MQNSIGENIKIMRRKCGFTQEELASMLSVTPQAVSKWENENGTPDISQIVPLAQIFGITTDSLLGMVSATYGDAHTQVTLGHEKLLMSSSQSKAEKHLAAYTYFRTESEKEPTNYTIMRRCINHGADISRYADFNGFLSDQPELLKEIFADCERKNLCITRYCEDKNNVEKSDYAMIWIYIHTKEFDKAKKLIDKLPSLESNNLKEHIMSKYLLFRYGFEKSKESMSENIEKLLQATGKELFFDFETYAYFAQPSEAVSIGEKYLHIISSYKTFEHLQPAALIAENRLRESMVRCYAGVGDLTLAGRELVRIAESYIEIASSGVKHESKEDAKEDAYALIENAINKIAERAQRTQIREMPEYKEAIAIIEHL